MISPVLERLTGDPSLKTGSGHSVDLVTVDIERQKELAQQYRVRPFTGASCFGGLIIRTDHLVTYCCSIQRRITR